MSDNKKELKIIQTSDKSFSVYDKKLDETYHSIHGALQESMHVYIDNGMRLIDCKDISILEVGLGTGLNASLSILNAESHNLKVHYHAVEAYPLDSLFIDEVSLGYPDKIKIWMQQIGRLPFDKIQYLNNNFSLTKHLIELQTFNTLLKYDLIYYDAFAPDKQPEMWTYEILSKIAGFLKPGGLITTYCAKGEVKRNLIKAGLLIETKKGPPGKREMVVAIKPF
jgi:tRNA U34 5-methylaminomethyl-2-thiouridine-forming methyltransferase MnmC